MQPDKEILDRLTNSMAETSGHKRCYELLGRAYASIGDAGTAAYYFRQSLEGQYVDTDNPAVRSLLQKPCWDDDDDDDYHALMQGERDRLALDMAAQCLNAPMESRDILQLEEFCRRRFSESGRRLCLDTVDAALHVARHPEY